jgi:hypothetical protein
LRKRRWRAWLERRQFEDNYRQGEPVTTARAESGGPALPPDDGWDAWRKFVDSRIQRYFEAHVEQLVERRVEERLREIRSELTEVAVATRKAVQAMAEAINKHAEILRQLNSGEERNQSKKAKGEWPDNQAAMPSRRSVN